MSKTNTRLRATIFYMGSALIGGILAANPVSAHHSFVAHYVADETVEVAGIVEEFWFQNPHARIVVNVESDTGETQRWIVETGAKNVLLRSGWKGDELQPGDRIEATGNASRDGSNTMQLQVLIMPDGSVFRSGGGGLRPGDS